MLPAPMLALGLLAAAVTVGFGAPFTGDSKDKGGNDEDAMRRATLNEGIDDPELVEGDIRINPYAHHGRQRQRGRRQTINAAYLDFYQLWPNAIVPYAISPLYQQSSVTVIKTAMADIQQRSCVKFYNASEFPVGYFGHPNTLSISSMGGCWSYVGYLGMEDQSVSLAETGCIYTGVVQHELLHALGFVHTQSRPDRDKFITVRIDTVNPGYEHNFAKSQYPSVIVNTTYDYYSAMHYGLTDFTAKSGVATIGTRQLEYSKLLGNRVLMSFYDEKALNSLYNCAGKCSITCLNDGYPRKLDDGTCVCKCPKGLGGTYCEDIDRTNYACGGVINLSDGTPVTIKSSNYPSAYVTGQSCAWLVKAKENRLVKLAFTKVSLSADSSKCRHFLDIRKCLIGQPAPYPVCGTGTPDDTYSCRNTNSGNAVLILFDASDTTIAASSGFSMTVSSYVDGCYGNPCRGAPCVTYPNSSNYTCILETGDVNCGFENSLSNGCKAVRIADLYDDYQSDVAQVSWETVRSSGDLSQVGSNAREGAFYLASNPLYNAYNNDSKCYGRFRIIPVSLAKDRCLRFQYYLQGDGVGSLLVYRAVNGTLGSPIFQQLSSTALDAWTQAAVTVTATSNAADLVEVVFEARHSSSNFDNLPIAIDDVIYNVGACGTSPCTSARCQDNTRCTPAGTSSYTCVPVLPDRDVSSSFESFENSSSWLSFTSPYEIYNWIGPGHAWGKRSNGTPGATGATGPATGVSYLYARLYNKAAGTAATLTIGAFGGQQRCLRFKYSMYGYDMGNLTVNRVVTLTSGLTTTTVLWSKSGNQGDAWWTASPGISVNTTLATGQSKIELTIVALRTSANYATDMALDDLSYTLGACSNSLTVNY